MISQLGRNGSPGRARQKNSWAALRVCSSFNGRFVSYSPPICPIAAEADANPLVKSCAGEDSNLRPAD